MFLLNAEDGGLPVKVWLSEQAELDTVCRTQAKNLSHLSPLRGWVALMPDTHQGFGMPIGGVIASKGHVIPNAVGVDIGCGMVFSLSDLKVEKLTEHHIKSIVKAIMQAIPLGFSHNKEKQASETLAHLIENGEKELRKTGLLFKEIDQTLYQLGTLGGGNHFIELQRDDAGHVGLMIHSGSRNFGYKIAQYFNEKAILHCKKNGDKHSVKSQLPYLPDESDAGIEYVRWMNLAMAFARENRRMMMAIVQSILAQQFPDIIFEAPINVHHNYAVLEEHLGEALWVHRKGAIRARTGDIGIIPGAMGTYSFIVEGLGNPESFHSCSHGAGRHLSRKDALKKFEKSKVLSDLHRQGVYLGTTPKSTVADEAIGAYKDIEYVMDQQADLVKPIKRLKTIAVVKG